MASLRSPLVADWKSPPFAEVHLALSRVHPFARACFHAVAPSTGTSIVCVLVRRPTTANVVDRAGGEAALFRREPSHEFGDLFGGADPAHGDQAGDDALERRPPPTSPPDSGESRSDAEPQDRKSVV